MTDLLTTIKGQLSDLLAQDGNYSFPDEASRAVLCHAIIDHGLDYVAQHIGSIFNIDTTLCHSALKTFASSIALLENNSDITITDSFLASKNPLENKTLSLLYRDAGGRCKPLPMIKHLRTKLYPVLWEALINNDDVQALDYYCKKSLEHEDDDLISTFRAFLATGNNFNMSERFLANLLYYIQIEHYTALDIPKGTLTDGAYLFLVNMFLGNMNQNGIDFIYDVDRVRPLSGQIFNRIFSINFNGLKQPVSVALVKRMIRDGLDWFQGYYQSRSSNQTNFSGLSLDFSHSRRDPVRELDYFIKNADFSRDVHRAVLEEAPNSLIMTVISKDSKLADKVSHVIRAPEILQKCSQHRKKRIIDDDLRF